MPELEALNTSHFVLFVQVSMDDLHSWALITTEVSLTLTDEL